MDYEKLAQSYRYRELEQQVVINLFNYNSFDEFYLEASCINYLHDIQVPSLFVSSKDDCLSPVDIIDYKKGKLN
jgi:predicted alpha/beta-fold hydrolase